jgi:hypothetical protein
LAAESLARLRANDFAADIWYRAQRELERKALDYE